MSLKLIKYTSYDDVMSVIDKTTALIDAEYVYRGLGKWRGIGRKAVKKGRCPEIKHVVDDAGNIAACAVYDNREGGSKISGIAGVHTHPDYREAVALIIKSDIADFDKWYWVEASGAVEHLFKKYNGYPIPFEYAQTFLQCDIQKECPDGFHYIRRLGLDDEVRKGVYGFRSYEDYLHILGTFKNYDEFRKKINADESREGDVKWAKHVVYNIEDLYTEHELNELPPMWKADLEKSQKILADAGEDMWAVSAEDLLDTLPVLEVIHVPG